MLLTLQVGLETDDQQKGILLETMERFNSACTYLASLGKCTNKYELQKKAYRELRERFGLNAQMTICAISRVVETWKARPESPPKFEPRSAITYDQRVLSFKGLDRASISTLKGETQAQTTSWRIPKGKTRRKEDQGSGRPHLPKWTLLPLRGG
jgi:predicted transposase